MDALAAAFSHRRQTCPAHQPSETMLLDMQAFLGEVYASFFFIFVLFGMVVDKRWVRHCAGIEAPALVAV